MNIPSTSALAGRKQVVDFAAVYVDHAITSPKCVPKKKRMRMIAKEMESLLDDAQDYLLRNLLDDDLGDEAKNSLFKAAMNSAYLKHNYDVTENKVVFYPTCKDLILNHNMISEAEGFYYTSRDEFPADYTEALEFAARDAERKIEIRERERQARMDGYTSYESDQDSLSEFDEISSPDIEVHCDPKVMEELSQSWSKRLSYY